MEEEIGYGEGSSEDGGGGVRMIVTKLSWLPKSSWFLSHVSWLLVASH
jgi:hypothetical protein